MNNKRVDKNWHRLVRVIFHSLGISCVAGVFFTYFLMFFDILTLGSFRAVEPNLVVAWMEVSIGCFGLVYFWVLSTKKDDSKTGKSREKRTSGSEKKT